MSHRGSLLCLAHAIIGWAPTTAAGLTIDDFAPLLAEAEGVELLLIGTGRDFLLPSPTLRAALRDRGVRTEPMDTGAACRTYNVLLGEGRPVGAALIAVD